MQIWKKIKRLSVKQLWKFFLLFMRYPLYLYPTYRATKKSMKVCNSLFGMSHHGRGQSNAFRHAYWNYEISRNCSKNGKNNEKSVIWTKKFTDLYEKVTRNDVLDREMDYHNNEVGRYLFLDIGPKNDAFLVEKLQKMSKNAQKVSVFEEIEQNKGKLVYLIAD